MYARSDRGLRRSTRSVVAVAALVGSSLSAGVVVVATSNTAAHAAGPTVTEKWAITEADAGNSNVLSPPMVATVGATQAAVFGDRAGNVYALDINNGGTLLWTAHSAWSGDTVDGPISQSGNVLTFGVGTWGKPVGGYQAVNATTGQTIWSNTVSLVPNGASNPPANNEGVIAGLTVDGANVFAGSLGQMADSFNDNSGAQQGGFPLFQGDTNSSTAAYAPVGPGGANELVYGGSQTGNAAQHLPQGGHVRILTTAGQVLCNYPTEQPVYSSPAVGPFLSGGAEGIVASTTYLYSGTGQNNDLMGFNTGCTQIWDRPLPGDATGSPVVVNAMGNHSMQVADTSYNTSNLNANGTLTLVNGATGAVIWTAATPGASLGGPVSVDLGGGYQDFVLSGTKGAEIVDGRTGTIVWTASDAPASQNQALVTQDSDGTVGLTFAGYTAVPVGGALQLETSVKHYEVSGSNGSLVGELGGWPEFHHDSALSGYAGAAEPYSVACSKPASPNGYIIVSTVGEVYNYGNIPYCGSTVNLPLNGGKIVAAAMTPDGGGYYLGSSNGGLFCFGDAKFYGAAASYHPGSPVVGIGVTTEGGYYQVTQAGGDFSFGPGATFYGSGASYPSASNTVGISTHPGGGYLEARAGGGLLAFPTPLFHGAATGTATPVVGLASAADGSGYWEFTSGGGVFTYGAPQEGNSTGNAVVAGVTDPNADGFWLVGPTGAVFAHGAAQYQGARNGYPLVYPIAGIGGA